MRTIWVLAWLIGCDTEPEAAEGDTTATGETAYRDAETDADGNAQAPERPTRQADGLRVFLHVSGSGTLSGLEPQCELEGAAGSFAGVLRGDGEIGDDGVYVAAFAREEGTFTTPSGACEIPELSIGSVTDVVVRGELQNTQENCESYCAAHARSEAEAACEGDADQASCRSEAETEAAAGCETECTGTTTTRIVAETSLGVDAIAAINAGALGAEGFGAIEADLTFDRVEETQE